jgi:glycosyltransferase involved in cell wall biosynthesis
VNLLLINYEYPPIGGGAGNATHFLAKAFTQLGHQVTVLTGAWQEHRGTFNEGGVKLIRISYPRKHPSMASPHEMILFVAKAFLALPKVMRENKITHAIIFFTIPNGPLGWYLKTRYGIPYIVSLRGGDVPGLVPEIEDVHRVITPLRRMALRKAKAIVANAEGLAELSRQADPFPVQVIPNGVDTQTFQPDVTKRDPHQFNIVFVGRFHRQKNLFLLLNSFAAFLKHCGSEGVRLHMIGQGPMEEDIRALSVELEIEPYVEWHGWSSKSELLAIHQTSHLMVNPSLYEGLPNAVLEGMASGLPIVVSDIPGNRDLVTPECGWSFPLEQEQQFFKCLVSAYERRSELTVMGLKARERVQQNYDWVHVAQKYAELLF